MLGKLKKIYQRTPKLIVSPIIKLFGITPIYSKKFWKELNEVDFKEVKFSQKAVFKELLKVIRAVEYYSKKEYQEFKDMPNLVTFQSLPLLNSEIVKENEKSIINDNIPGYYTSTGGSGRNPLKIYLSNKSYYLDRKYVFYAWSKLGYQRNTVKLTLRGVNLKSKLFEFNPMNNEIIINVFLMNDSNILKIVKGINKYSPTFGHGYPSAWFNFTSLLKNNDLRLKRSLTGIYFASESINEQKRDFVESFFKTKVRATYGLSERSCFAYEKENEKGNYRILNQYGIIEIIKDNGDLAGVGETGEIVATGLMNKGMPLIRYKTGDHAKVLKKENDLVVEIGQIVGRWGKDFILDKDGNKIYTTAINVHTASQFDFKYIQLQQEKKGELIIHFVPFDKLVEKSLNEVLEEFTMKLSNVVITASIITFDELYKTKRGKIPFLIKLT